MSDFTLSPAQHALDTSERLLANYASELGLPIASRPNFASSIFSGGSDTASARLESSDLPNHVRGLQVGRYAVLLTLFPEASDELGLSEMVRRVRNQCVVARSYLSPVASLDLHAILLGPRGSDGLDRWKALALIAERDERVARKLVWLRPSDASTDEQSFAAFAKRTFLARPWVSDAVFSMVPLDNLSRAALIDGDSRDTSDEWVDLAVDPDMDPDQLVTELVVSWQRRGAT